MFEVNHEIVLKNLYKKPAPNRYLASFSLFAGQYRNHPLIQKLIEQNFEDYFTCQLENLKADKKIPLGIIGSVGYHFQEIFLSIAQKYGYGISTFLQQPIHNLTEYHRDEL